MELKLIDDVLHLLLNDVEIYERPLESFILRAAWNEVLAEAVFLGITRTGWFMGHRMTCEAGVKDGSTDVFRGGAAAVAAGAV